MILLVGGGMIAFDCFLLLTGRRTISRARGLWRIPGFAFAGWLIAHLIIEAAAEDREERAMDLVVGAWRW